MPTAPATQYLALAGTALTMGLSGTAWAGTISEVPSGYTPQQFSSGQVGALGSFDVSGAGYDVIDVVGTAATSDSTSPSKPAKIAFSNPSSTGTASAISTNTIAGSNGMAAAFTVPQTSVTTGSGTEYISKGTASNFSTTPLYGATTFTENGVQMYGYFTGTFSNSTFTLLDYGIVTNAPEPASLALLATGLAGITALRRRNSARR